MYEIFKSKYWIIHHHESFSWNFTGKFHSFQTKQLSILLSVPQYSVSFFRLIFWEKKCLKRAANTILFSVLMNKSLMTPGMKNHLPPPANTLQTNRHSHNNIPHWDTTKYKVGEWLTYSRSICKFCIKTLQQHKVEDSLPPLQVLCLRYTYGTDS